jgi:hypothetical protein
MKPIHALFVLLLASATPASALEWHARGPRALAMGGAGVALAQGPLASYWNPAALGRSGTNSYGVQVPLGAHVALTGTVYEGMKDLQALRDRTSVPTAAEQNEINAALDKLDQPGNGLRFDGDFGVDSRIGKFGIFLNGTSDVGAQPVVDRANFTAAQIRNGQNNSKLVVKGANIGELGVAYGHELPFAQGLYVGGALKIMNADVGYADYFILRDDSGQNDIVSKLKNGARKSANVGVDAAALWDVDRSFGGVALKPKLGLVGRNLNNPKFKNPATATAAGHGDSFTVNPQVRLGLALTPFNWWNIAADVDLTRNLTPVDNAASRQLGIGSEFNVFNRAWLNIPLRVGLRRNLAEASAGTMLTAGVGLNFLHVMLDASAAVSNRHVTTSANEKIPREVNLGFQFSLLFGGGDEIEAPAPARDDQAIPTEKVRAASDKAQEDLKVEELKKSAPATKP